MNIKAKDVGSSHAFLAKAWAEFEPLYREQSSLTHVPEQFRLFVERFFHQYPLQELVGKSWQDGYGLVFCLWQFLQNSNAETRKVRVFNPELEQHGWISSHTVVIALCRDMPFVVDSLRMEINRHDTAIHAVKSTVVAVERNSHHALTKLLPPTAGEKNAQLREALVFLEIDLQTENSVRDDLAQSLDSVLQDVELVVQNYQALTQQVENAITNIQATANIQAIKNHIKSDEVERSESFLRWLTSNNFTFMGYREYQLVDEEGKPVLQECVDKRLGLATKAPEQASKIPMADRYPGVSEFYSNDQLITFAKSHERSRVHRAAYSDHVVVKRFDDQGRVCGECRFSGLYTSAVYVRSPNTIPIIGEKIQWVLEQSGFAARSHDGKYLRQILETFPRDELFLSTHEELYDVALKTAQINERHQVRLFMRRGHYGKFVSCLVFVPRDMFSTEVRLKIQQLLGEAVGATDEEFTTYFSESILARVHLVFRVNPENAIEYDVAQLQDEIIDIVRTWEDKLASALVENLGEGEGLRQYRRFKHAFPPAYKEDVDVRTAVHDIEFVNSLKNSADIATCFYQPLSADTRAARFKVFRRDKVLELSDVIPILEKLGLRVVGEVPYRLKVQDQANEEKNCVVWLHDFSLTFYLESNIDVNAASHLFQDAFRAVWEGHSENDDFNRLVLGARLNWREVSLLRAYSAYMKQTLFNFSQAYIATTLVQHLEVTRNLVALFKAKFDPRFHKKTEKDCTRIERLVQKITDALEQVDNLNEDRILRRYLDFVKATLRTNFFQALENNTNKSYISLKLAPRELADIPEPRPKFEIFVYSPRIEGVHLRGGSVARGGLRWSDRMEDFRTEVLGLVKAQQVKNAVIVPEGAKGGFVAKQSLATFSRDEMLKEGIECYKTFIRGLLDITDNLVDNKVLAPTNVVRWDEDDPYLVVAADKGTATFSDIANGIAKEYQFWLGDAFASGGSLGYDHKGMGITAKGGWVSVRRHFKELNIDVQKQDFTVIGIGDMAGDVFGNGLLLSQHIALVAAFNHMHIFIDPNPNVAKSFEERKRLFQLPKSSWSDYNAELISAGGGVLSRTAKSIAITPQMRERFAIDAEKLSPTELIHALLKAPVDLLWNGGIGTYVKSSRETNADVGDKANDALRVNGNELRCRVFGEGGNLGMTQLGRVEFALNGGACNTDFIDNSAGVDCSDHEVNIKILLNGLVANGEMTEKQRNQLLASMTDAVADLVLKNNYAQTQAISIAQAQALPRMGEYQRFIRYLESNGKLKRRLEFIPDDDALVERLANGQSLTRPELSILVSYAKVELKKAFNDPELTENEYILPIAKTAFPKILQEKYSSYINQHRLKNEIVATQLANDMINNMGVTFCQRLMESTGATAVQVAKAYVAARDLYQFNTIRKEIEALDFNVEAHVQFELLAKLIRRVRRATRWFLRNRRGSMNPAQEVERFAPLLQSINTNLPKFLRGDVQRAWETEHARLSTLGLPTELVDRLAMPSSVYSGLGMVEVSLVSNVSPIRAAEIFSVLGDAINLHWFANQLSEVKVENYWQAMARESYMDDLEAQMRSLAISFVRLTPEGRSIDETLAAWTSRHQDLLRRWSGMMAELQASSGTDFAMFSVALRELLDLVQASQHCEFLFEKSESDVPPELPISEPKLRKHVG